MLIKKMLGMQKVDDYVFAEYEHKTGGTIALLVKTGDDFYDFSNKQFVSAQSVNYTRPFRYYISIDAEYLSKRKAKKLAELHYSEFFQEYQESYIQDQEIFLDTDKTFKFYYVC